MAQLSSVIGSILRDIVSAQHEANLYSLSLGDSYGKDGKAKDFQLPNVGKRYGTGFEIWCEKCIGKSATV